MRRMKWIAVLAIVSGVGLTACGGDAEEVPATEQPAAAPQPEEAPAPAEPAGPLPEGVTQEMVAAGKQVFEGNGICFTCHGMDGKGTALAPDLTGGKWLWVDPAAGDLLGQIEARIKEGVRSEEHTSELQSRGHLVCRL